MSFDFILAGASGLFFLFLLVRVVTRGLGNSFADRTKAFRERVRKTDMETRDQALAASPLEQMRPIGAAVREMLELSGKPPGFMLLEEGKTVRLQCPEGELRIVFHLSTRPLSGARNGGAGPQGRWCIAGPAEKEYTEHCDLAGAAARLHSVFTRKNSAGDARKQPERK